MHSHKEPDCTAGIASPVFDSLSDKSTTIDSAVSYFSLDDTKGTDYSPESLQQLPLVGFRSFVSGCMQADCISTLMTTTGRPFAKSSPSIIFLDWDDGLFPTTEMFDHWRVPRDAACRKGFRFSSAQLSLLDSWQEAIYEYLTTCCKLSRKCIVLANSERPCVQECIDSFAPKLRAFFDSSDGPVVIYASDADADLDTDSTVGTAVPELSGTSTGQAESYYVWKHEAMRREAKKFYTRHQGHLSVTYNLDMIDELSFQECSMSVADQFLSMSRRPRCPPRSSKAPSISQVSMRMCLDSQQIQSARSFDIPAVDLKADLKPIACPFDGRGQDLPVQNSPERCPLGVSSFGRSKPLHVDFSHRTELAEYRDDLIEIQAISQA